MPEKKGVKKVKKGVKTTAKTVAPKKTTRKTSTKKGKSTKKTPTKSAVTKTASRKSAKKTAKKNKSEAAELTLPTNVSLRTKAKARAIETNLDGYINLSILRTAYVSAFCFILVGSALALSSFNTHDLRYSQKSELISSQLTNTTATDFNEQTDVEGPLAEVFAFDFLTTLSNVIQTSTKVRFSVTGVQSVKAYLVPQGGFSGDELMLEQVSNSVYETHLGPGLVDDGYYELKVFSTLLNQDLQVHTDGPFLIKSEVTQEEVGDEESEEQLDQTEEENGTEPDEIEETNPLEEESITGVSSTTIPTESTRESEEPDNQVVTTNSTESSGRTPSVNNNETSSSVDTTDNSVETEDTEESDDTAPEVPPTEFSQDELFELSFNLKNPVLNSRTKALTIPLETNGNFELVELYGRKTNSLNEQFVGLGVRTTSGWKFNVNTKNLPNGFYQFKARAERNNEDVVSNGMVFNIQNVVALPESPTPVSDTEASEVIPSSPPQNISEFGDESQPNTLSVAEDLPTEVAVPLREFEEFDEELETEQVPEVLTKEEFVKEETKKVLRDNSEDLNSLLRNFAVAVQTGDTISVDLAKNELESKRREIVSAGLQDPETRDNIDDINNQLEKEIAVIKKKVEDFEVLRREKTQNDISSDRDGDGISDFDEVNIYKTNPDSADTDNDGFNDNVEVLRGFDPLDSEPEAPVAFESPKETIGLVREDVLKVEAVSSVVTNSDRDQVELPPVRAEIKGKALPNSFVTLFIFSSPTVVTVRTDKDGSFAYTFDKELEDGSHEVYVAVTDNTGSIIAQSNPFSFIKEAEAFSPVTESVDAVPTTPVNTTPVSANDYTLVIGMSVISFGVILLLLGMGIKTKREDDFIVAGSDKHWPKVDIHNKSSAV